MKLFRFICILFAFSFLLVGCNKSKTLTDQRLHKMIDEGFREGFSEDHNVLIHKEEVDNGIVVFYGESEVKNILGVRFIEKTFFDWEATYDRGGGGFGSSVENIHSIFLPKMDKKSPFPILLGLITNSEIEQIEVEYKYGSDVNKVKAKTIQGKDRYIWFAFVEEPKEKTTYKIMGYSSTGKLIETIEEESVHLQKN